jgi:hypothetical protein
MPPGFKATVLLRRHMRKGLKSRAADAKVPPRAILVIHGRRRGRTEATIVGKEGRGFSQIIFFRSGYGGLHRPILLQGNKDACCRERYIFAARSPKPALFQILQACRIVVGPVGVAENHRGLGSIAHIQYRENTRQLVLDGFLLKIKFGRDLLVGPSERHKPKYPALPLVQFLGGRFRRMRCRGLLAVSLQALPPRHLSAHNRARRFSRSASHLPLLPTPSALRPSDRDAFQGSPPAP